MTRLVRRGLCVALVVGAAIAWPARDAAAQQGPVSITCAHPLVVAQGPSVFLACDVLPLNGYQGHSAFSCGPVPGPNQQTPEQDVSCAIWSSPRLDQQTPSSMVLQIGVGRTTAPGFWLAVTANDPQQPKLGQALSTIWVNVAPLRAVALIREDCGAPISHLRARFRVDKTTGLNVFAGTDPAAFTYDLRLENLGDLTDVFATIGPTTVVNQTKVQSPQPMRLQGGNAIQVFDGDPCANGQDISKAAAIVVRDDQGLPVDWRKSAKGVAPASIEVHARVPASHVVWVRVKARSALQDTPGWSDDDVRQLYQLQDVQATLHTAGGTACGGKCELTGSLHAPLKLSRERPVRLTVPMKPLRFALETVDSAARSDHEVFGTLTVVMLGDERIVAGTGGGATPGYGTENLIVRAEALDVAASRSSEVLGDDFVLRLRGPSAHPFISAPGVLLEGDLQGFNDGVFTASPCDPPPSGGCNHFQRTEAWLEMGLALELVTAGGQTYHTHVPVWVACPLVEHVPPTTPAECGVRSLTRIRFYAEDENKTDVFVTTHSADPMLDFRPPSGIDRGPISAGRIAFCGISRFDYLGSPSAKRVAGAACLLLPLAVLAALRRRERRRAAGSRSARD